MTPESFEFFCGLVKARSGLVLSKDKGYLLESRLMPVARKWNFQTLDMLAAATKADINGKSAFDIVEAMTTNESFFFRDSKPFQQFSDMVLPRLIEARAKSRTLRIWSAAASNGQEPYTIAMLIKEAADKMSGWRVEILATDISREVLERAKAGVYTQFEVQRGLPIQMLVKYFTQIGERWQIHASLRSMVSFREYNLLDDPRRFGTFDVIFCRNVLIYFDQQTKTGVLDGLSAQMSDDGILYLGGAETVIGITERFRPMPGQRGVYEVVKSAAIGQGAAAPARSILEKAQVQTAGAG